jgi:hypothetical protein
MVKLEPAGGGTSPIFAAASDTIVKTWIPGIYTVRDSLALPGNMKPGLYALKIAFCYPDSNRPAIKLANYGKDSAGWYAFSTVTVGNVSVVKTAACAGKFSGLQVSCNPYNHHTVIQFLLPQERLLALNVYNVKGMLVRGLGQVSGPPGPGRIQWDGMDGSGAPLPEGAYLIRATVNGSTNGVKRIFLAR